MGNWTNKVAVICGGSSGLGLSLAQTLIAENCRILVLIGRDPNRLNTAKQQLSVLAKQQSASTDIQTIAADLANAAQAEQCAQQLHDICPQVDLLVQAIGVSDRGKLVDLSRQRLLELIDANVVTSLHAVRYFASSLQACRGVIVFIGSLASLFSPRFLGGYSISKHALLALAQQARLEMADDSVHVLLCCPGPIERGDAGQRYQNHANSGLPQEAMQPGGGAKVNLLSPELVSREILIAAAKRKPLLILPRKAGLLRVVTAISQRLGDFILRRKSQ